jgi:hypothetical protein
MCFASIARKHNTPALTLPPFYGENAPLTPCYTPARLRESISQPSPRTCRRWPIS